MIGTRSDDWKWVAIWLAFACLLERQVPPTPERGNPLRPPVRENATGPINRVAMKIVELSEAVIGVVK